MSAKTESRSSYVTPFCYHLLSFQDIDFDWNKQEKTALKPTMVRPHFIQQSQLGLLEDKPVSVRNKNSLGLGNSCRMIIFATGFGGPFLYPLRVFYLTPESPLCFDVKKYRT